MNMITFSRVFLAAVSLFLATAAWSGDYQTGRDAYDIGDYSTALTVWQPLAEGGDANGQFGLGLLYGNGFGVDMIDEQALLWYGKAADQGHAAAQCNLAVMHLNGWGVPMNEEEAAKYYLMAAEQGITEAQIALGLIFAADYSPLYNKEEAYKWFSVADRLGDLNAGPKREDQAARLSADEVIEADGMVSMWFESHGGMVATDDEY
jgi:TPR repeat protein